MPRPAMNPVAIVSAETIATATGDLDRGRRNPHVKDIPGKERIAGNREKPPDKRGLNPEHGILDELDERDLTARGPKRAKEHRLPHPLVPAGEDGSGKDDEPPSPP